MFMYVKIAIDANFYMKVTALSVSIISWVIGNSKYYWIIQNMFYWQVKVTFCIDHWLIGIKICRDIKSWKGLIAEIGNGHFNQFNQSRLFLEQKNWSFLQWLILKFYLLKWSSFFIDKMMMTWSKFGLFPEKPTMLWRTRKWRSLYFWKKWDDNFFQKVAL